MADLPGRGLARELIEQSRAEIRRTPMEDVIEAARARGQGLEMNDFPPAIKYLFARQIVDESTHEMLYLDTLLHKGWVATQKAAFRHPYGAFAVGSALAYYVFSLRNLATYPHNIRIGALNLGPKILELGWMEGLGESLGDDDLGAVFASQLVEIRSHVNMGRRVVEEFVEKPVDAEL